MSRFPLSSPQQLWCSGDQGDHAGFFAGGFVMATALRITGPIDVAALQGALDDLVRRHEILRTVVARTDEPYQEVHEAAPVPLVVRDVPADRPGSRDEIAEELLNEAERSTLDPRRVPQLRAVLSRFDAGDAVLALITHHTGADEWSNRVLVRDLAATYRARVTGTEAALPPVPQYRDFAAAQRAAADGPDGETAAKFWREKLSGVQIFAVPTDREVPERHHEPYSASNFVVDRDVMRAVGELAAEARTDVPTVLLAAFNVLVHAIAGTTDQAIDTLTTGRTDPRFDDTVGPVMNFVVLRTDLARCLSYRDVVAATRDVCLETYANEIPIQHIERAVPELMQPNDEPRKTNCIVGVFPRPSGAGTPRIADGCTEIYKRPSVSPIGPWIPHGVAWGMHPHPSGELSGCVQFNAEDLDADTVSGWTGEYQRILAAMATDPGRSWTAPR
ncbi:hypothetical protein GCM10010168_45670 [Actinoplanes ianthinogenes]|uniref:Condensation domain-containing protein n=1 Tax=Actinoplanes ianthinogenes TaxID=122358 RepID=A0ABM7LPG2_9ACTN|nr:condensation domain-containing protein [Actinoplanes ianthinogenes]BCJ41135.1 hypothetical protein Aiant_17920 [Actinoplanes ianthinogenes]GGR22678.1 hypothetical protein GCM10010168_45670 [Actinoplanes ianthinogenes]